MCDFFARNLVVILVALVAGVTAWVFGGTRGDLLPYFLPGLLAFLFEGLLFFPQGHADETAVEARERVWRALRRDPLTWVSATFIVLLLVPLANRGLCFVCDAEAIAAGVDPTPPVPFLPFCVNARHHLNVVWWFVSALICMLAVRHALTARGKRMLLAILVWNGVALALLGFVQCLAKAGGPLWDVTRQTRSFFFSTFGYANMAGDFFTALFVLSLGLWRRTCDETYARRTSARRHSGWSRPSPLQSFLGAHVHLLASAVLLGAAFATGSRSAALLSTVAAGVVLVHSGIVAFARQDRLRRVRSAALMLAVAAVGAVICLGLFPRSLVQELSKTSVNEVFDRLTGRTEYHFGVAGSIFAEHPAFGVGGWGYRHFSLAKTPENVSKFFIYSWTTGGANVHNDYLQFLAEHGVVGFGLLAAIFVFLMRPIVRKWAAMAREVSFLVVPGLPPPHGFFVLPTSAFAMLVAAGTTMLHALGDCPLRSPAILDLLFIELAAVDGFLPRAFSTKKSEDV